MRSASPCEMIWYPEPPIFAPASRRMTSLSRTTVPLSKYSFCPSRYTMRLTTTSLKSISRRRVELSKVTLTPARLARGNPGLPPQIRYSPFLERMLFIDCSPSTKRKASATLDLPEPLGPTMEEMRDWKTSSVFLPNDLNPESSIDFRYIYSLLYQKELPQTAVRGMSVPLVTESRPGFLPASSDLRNQVRRISAFKHR